MWAIPSTFPSPERLYRLNVFLNGNSTPVGFSAGINMDFGPDNSQLHDTNVYDSRLTPGSKAGLTMFGLIFLTCSTILLFFTTQSLLKGRKRA